MHLLVDGFGGDLEKLKSQEFVYKFLDEFPSSINMNKISGPHVTTYNGPVEKDWGVSGFVMIAESHISIHTFPDRSYTNIDIFSCKDFDEEKALSLIGEAFNFRQTKQWSVGRGLAYITPESVSESMTSGMSSIIRI